MEFVWLGRGKLIRLLQKKKKKNVFFRVFFAPFFPKVISKTILFEIPTNWVIQFHIRWYLYFFPTDFVSFAPHETINKAKFKSDFSA
jgi:hypothetical protein